MLLFFSKNNTVVITFENTSQPFYYYMKTFHADYFG